MTLRHILLTLNLIMPIVMGFNIGMRFGMFGVITGILLGLLVGATSVWGLSVIGTRMVESASITEGNETFRQVIPFIFLYLAMIAWPFCSFFIVTKATEFLLDRKSVV